MAPISTLDVQDFSQLTAYSFEQPLCNGKCRFKFGQQDANSDLFNKANITPWLFIQPDVQWLTSVGGAAIDAVVVAAHGDISG